MVLIREMTQTQSYHIVTTRSIASCIISATLVTDLKNLACDKDGLVILDVQSLLYIYINHGQCMWYRQVLGSALASSLHTTHKHRQGD